MPRSVTLPPSAVSTVIRAASASALRVSAALICCFTSTELAAGETAITFLNTVSLTSYHLAGMKNTLTQDERFTLVTWGNLPRFCAGRLAGEESMRDANSHGNCCADARVLYDVSVQLTVPDEATQHLNRQGARW